MATETPWSTDYPGSQDDPVTTNQPDLDDDTVPGDDTGDRVLSNQIETLRDKLGSVAQKVGDDGGLPAGSHVEQLGKSIQTNKVGRVDTLADEPSPANTDLFIMERASDGTLRKVEAQNLPGGGGPGSDTDAIHDNVAGEIAAITAKGSPVAADLVIIEDSEDSNNKKAVQLGNLPSGTDVNAVHVNVAAEINAITEKPAPIAADLLLIEDSADSNNKKKIQIGNLPKSTIISPAQITADQDNYAPTGWSTATHVRLDSDAARNITGVDASAVIVQKKLINVGSNNITIKHEDAGSTAANRFLSFTGADIVLQPNDSLDIFIDVTTGKVRAGV